MKLVQFLLVFTMLFISCNDPSIDQQGDGGDGIVEPVLELTKLSTIEIAQDVMTNVVEDIEILYNQDDLVSQVSFNGIVSAVYTFEYAANNRLETAIKNSGTTTIYNFSYTADSVFLEYTDLNGDLVDKQFFTDTQNRINRVVTGRTDTAGNSTQTEDLRYQYTANFNVNRINRIDANGFTVNGYSEFTYEFNNNPFTDMNDVVRLIVFPEFIPYTRYLPSSRMDYTAQAGSFVIDRFFAYSYILQDDEFPRSREIIKTESGVTTSFFEFFNYL
jgi:hypothetical protein